MGLAWLLGLRAGSLTKNILKSIVYRTLYRLKGVRYEVKIELMAEYFNVKVEEIMRTLPPEPESFEPWKGATKTIVGFFRTETEVDEFHKAALELKKHAKKK